MSIVVSFPLLWIWVVQQDQIDEDDEKLLEAFLSTDSRPQWTLADIIVERIKEKDAQVSAGLFLIFLTIMLFMLCFWSIFVGNMGSILDC